MLSKIKPYVYLVIILMIFQIPRIIYGLGVSDSGHNLAKQQALFVFHEISGGQATTLLSDFIGGFWHSLAPSWGLIWMRIGGAFLNLLNALLSFYLLSLYVAPSRAFLLCLCASMLLIAMTPYELMVHYYTVPAALLSIVLYFIATATSKKNKLDLDAYCRFAAAGGILGLAILARLPLAILVFVAILAFLIAHYRAPKDQKPYILFASAYFMGSLIVVFLITMAILMGLHLWGPYLESLQFTFGNAPGNDLAEYSLQQLLPQYISRGLKALMLAALAYGCIWILARTKLAKEKWLKYGITIGVVVVLFYFNSRGPNQALFRFREIMFGLIIIALIMALIKNRSTLFTSFGLTTILGSCIAAAIAFGSTLGLQGSTHGMWFALPAAVFLLASGLADENFNKTETKCVIYERAFAVSLVFVAILIYLHPQEYAWKFDRTGLIRSFNSAAYNHPKLRGIIDDPTRVRQFNELTDVLTPLVHKGDTCLFFNHIGILYWLTESRSFFRSPVLYHSHDGVVAWQINEKMTRGIYPKLVVLNNSKYNTKLPTEVLKDIKTIEERIIAFMKLSLIYSNESYSVYFPIAVPKEIQKGILLR